MRRLKNQASHKTVEAAEKVWLSTQFKIMDIAHSILNVYELLLLNNFPVGHPLRDGIESALQQWARAFNHVSRRRRHNVLACAAPRSAHLLEASDAFCTEEAIKKLFGQTFLDAMLKEANQELTLNQIEAAATASTSTQSRSRANPGAQRGRGRGSRGGKGRGRGNRYEPYSFINWSNLLCGPLITNKPAVGGRLKFFADNWSLISVDNWVRQSVKGVALDFESIPSQNFPPSAVAMSVEMQNVCDKEVADLLEKHAIVEVLDGSWGFLSSLFVIPKKSGGFRPIVNLKPLNKFIQYEHFKMEGLETVKSLVRKGDWLVKLDLKDAYLTVPVLPAHQKFLRFVWRKRTYQFSCLAFGLCSAPRIFTKLMKVVVGFLRERGLRLVVYLDDLLLLNENEAALKADLKMAVSLLESLGFLINWEKSLCTPTQALEYLGVIIVVSEVAFKTFRVVEGTIKSIR